MKAADLPYMVKTQNVRGKRVILRVDFNVATEAGGAVADDFRIARSLPTISFLRNAGAKVLIISHRTDGGSLNPVAEYMGIEFIPYAFSSDFREETRIKAHIAEAGEGSVFLFENLRHEAVEKANDPVFAARIASFGDCYVNEAFAASHRAHASIMSVPKLLPHFAGPLFIEEVECLSRAFNPRHQFVVVLGGAKFSTKIPLIERFMPLADKIFIYGALAHPLLHERGVEIGKSFTEEVPVPPEFTTSDKLVLPCDACLADGSIRDVRELSSGDVIMDIGPASEYLVAEAISSAQFVLWNGPFGFFEKGFDASTKNFARLLADSPAETIIGGGDTLAAIKSLDMLDKFGFVSTGGGAMLEFLAKGTLPGIEALFE